MSGPPKRVYELTGAGVEELDRRASDLAEGERRIELGTKMGDAGAETVSELDPETIDGLVERLWVVPPGGSLL